MSSVNSNGSFHADGKLDVLSLQGLEYVTGGKKPAAGGGNSATSLACVNSAMSISCVNCNSTVSRNCGGKAAMFVDLYEI